MNELALFAGAGGGILGGHLLGWRTVCAVEWEPYAAGVLIARQNDGILPPFPVWDDVRTFDGRGWRGVVDVVSGGFPCQDISCAGKGAGIDGERSGMWVEMARIIGEVGPRFVLVENSPMLTLRGLGRVLGDLVALGYDARWGVLGADDAIWDQGDPCADHERCRMWIVCEMADSSEIGFSKPPPIQGLGWQRFGEHGVANGWWKREPEQTSREAEPGVGRVADGVAARVDRLAALGNGQVPSVAALAWRVLWGGDFEAGRWGDGEAWRRGDDRIDLTD